MSSADEHISKAVSAVAEVDPGEQEVMGTRVLETKVETLGAAIENGHVGSMVKQYRRVVKDVSRAATEVEEVGSRIGLNQNKMDYLRGKLEEAQHHSTMAVVAAIKHMRRG